MPAQIDEAAPRAFAVVGDPAPAACWEGVLQALARWPLPETLTLERRLVRAGTGVEEHLVVSTGAQRVLADADDRLAALLRPIAAAAGLRPRAPSPVRAVADVTVLDGIGSWALGGGELVAHVAADVARLPHGAGLGVVVWAGPADDEPGIPRLVGRAGEGIELQLVGLPPDGMRAAIRLWSPAPLPPSLLARVAALAGAPADRWAPATRACKREAAVAALRAGRPPAVGDEPERRVSLSAVAELLATPDLRPGASAGAGGRPWTAPLPRDGATFGRVLSASGSLRRLHVPWRQRERHMLICGRTGSGKSELLLRLIEDDLRAGRGLVVIDPHGDLIEDALGLVPDARRDEVVLIEPADERTAALPVLMPERSTRTRLARLDDALVDLHGTFFNSGRWRRPGGLLLDAFDAIGAIDPTLVGLDAAMNDDHVRLGLQVAASRAPDVARRLERTDRLFWDRGTQMATGLAASSGRHALDHAPRWDLDGAVVEGGIVLAKLDVGRLGTLDTSRLGRVLLRLLLNALAALAQRPDGVRPRTSVIVDEAHLFTATPTLGAMLAQVRKFGGGLTLCTQTPSRFGDLLPDIVTNTGTVLAMQLPSREARAFADRCAPAVLERLPTLPRHHAIALLDGEEGADRPLVVRPLPRLPRDPSRAEATRDAARRRYGRTPELAARGDLTRLETLADHVSGLLPRSALRPSLRTTPAAALAGAGDLDAAIDAALAGRPLPARESVEVPVVAAERARTP